MSSQFQLSLFAITVLSAAILMIKNIKIAKKADSNIMATALMALVIGILSGIVGVGGGFLIVPTLVLLMGLDMKKAVGTSLFVICINSFSGVIGHFKLYPPPWEIIGKFIVFSGLGMLIGVFLSQKIDATRLKKIFSYFLIGMGLFIGYQQI